MRQRTAQLIERARRLLAESGYGEWYHESPVDGLDELRASSPDKGGIGTGVYLSPQGAPTMGAYGDHLYRVEVQVDPEDVLELTPHEPNVEVHRELESGGQHAAEAHVPFGFEAKGGTRVWVGTRSEADRIEATAIQDRVAEWAQAGRIDGLAEPIVDMILEAHPDGRHEAPEQWWSWDPEWALEELAQAAGGGFAELERRGAREGESPRETIERLESDMADLIELVEDRGLADEVGWDRTTRWRDIGRTADQLGYGAVYVEGLRTGETLPELLVLDADDTEIVGQVR